jgi:hypothetical protein
MYRNTMKIISHSLQYIYNDISFPRLMTSVKFPELENSLTQGTQKMQTNANAENEIGTHDPNHPVAVRLG